MPSIEKQLLPDEQVLYKTKKHIIIFLNPIIFTLIALIANYYMHYNPILVTIEYVPWIMAAILWVQSGLMYLTSVFVITNKRIYMREGFFYVHTSIMRLSAVVDVEVRQSLLGHFLDYGSLLLNAFGSLDAFANIAHPHRFRQVLTTALDKLTDG